MSMSRDPKASYYDVGGIETLDIIKAKLTPEEYLGYIRGNLLKYSCRLRHKGDPERDAEKVTYYAVELLEALRAFNETGL